MNKFIVFFLFCFFLSCSEQEKVSVLSEEIRVENVKKIRKVKLQPTILIDSVLGAFSISNNSKNLFLRVEENSQSKGLVQIFDKKGRLNATVINKGGGPNDVINARLIKQKDEEGNLWINDISSRKLKLLNVSKSILHQSAVFEKIIGFDFPAAYAFYINDSFIGLETFKKGNYWLTFFNPESKTTIFDKQIYPVPSKHSEYLYRSVWAMNNNRSWVVGAMEALNQINFIALNDVKKSFSVCLGELTDIQNATNQDGIGKRVYYCDVDVASNCVFALKLDQSEEESFEILKPVTIDVLDWKGKPLCILEINEYILDISIDEKAKKMYGLDINGTVYEYDLNAIL